MSAPSTFGQRPNAYPGKLFIVGDPKQAIYRFRRADIGTYEEVKRLLLTSGAELMQLTTSFRSLPSIQAMINRAFEPHICGPRLGDGGSTR